jgi:hypothetical protein
MAVVSAITRNQGVLGITKAYEATSALKLVGREGQDLVVNYASITGAMTINCTFTNLLQFQRVIFNLTGDTTSRTITFGTGFINLAASQMRGSTLILPKSANATVETMFDGTALRILAVVCEGKGEVIQTTAYAAAIEVTDVAAKHHIVAPAQLTGALTLNATAVTNHLLGDEFVFHFSTDGTQRVVTFGTNILSSGTITIPANKTATARGFFNGTSICISGREISA